MNTPNSSSRRPSLLGRCFALVPSVLRLMIVGFTLGAVVHAQSWTSRVCGSWAREGQAEPGDVTLFDGQSICDIAVAGGENSAVKQAAIFLAGDLEKLTGKRPAIVQNPVAGHVTIHLATAPTQASTAPWSWSFHPGDWEAFDIRGSDKDVFCTGSNFRGTAFASYTLSERLGIDPLYLWTGYRPARHAKLVLRQTRFSSSPPTFKYRGTFHDDEDILPRPFDRMGYTLMMGDVPTEWYARYFETLLRLRMNMVAPYTRVHRRYEVQKLASDWGLFYTSHHYDILLSNPFGFGFDRFSLGAERHAGNTWDWFKNRTGMINFWKGGVEENKDLYCIWPVGLRSTTDRPYEFPAGTTELEKAKTYRDVIDLQLKLVKEALPPDRPALFHFTIYNEMLDYYLKAPAEFGVPADVIIVWPDNNDGLMRFLPPDLGKWKHGIYYHLAYLGGPAKQNAHIVTPGTVAREFKKVVEAGATDYMLVNVSEMREFIMETREIAEICWDANTALADEPAQPLPAKALRSSPTAESASLAIHPSTDPAGDKYVAWWCREYFGEKAAGQAADVYHRYYQLLNSFDKLWLGSDQVKLALESLRKRFSGGAFSPPSEETRALLQDRASKYEQTLALAREATANMDRQQRQFFFDHVELPLLMDYRPTLAALDLIKALGTKDRAAAWADCESAMRPLEELETEIARTEHPPFEGWYRETWVRTEERNLNVHRPFKELRAFLSSGGMN